MGLLMAGVVAVTNRTGHQSLAEPAPAVSTVAKPVARLEPAAPALVTWNGPVEQLFFHPLVQRPERAFTSDRLGRGFADYFVTVAEFRRILDQLWRNGWTLVDVHRAAAGTVRVPVGRKPMVLSVDDVNYYDYFVGRGLASRLVLDGDRVRADAQAAVGDDDIVPLVDAAVRAHPEFSAEGAKGVLGLTGYQGLFGERDLADVAARARVAVLADRLRATGWTMASHTYGHMTLATSSTQVLRRDTARWIDLTRSLLGPVDVLIYPFGSRPSTAGVRQLRDAGFTIHLDIDVRPTHVDLDGVIRMGRRHIDGLAFEAPRRLRPFFDVGTVRDNRRP